MNPEALKRLRLLAGLSQYELARRASIAPDTISRVERGERTLVRSDTLAALAQALANALPGRDKGQIMAELTDNEPVPA